MPLNRSLTSDYDSEYRNMRMQGYHQYGHVNRTINPDKRDKSLNQVEMLIYDKVRKVNDLIYKISEKFRNEILKSSLDVNASFKFEDLYKEIKSYSKEKIEKIRDSYIDILTALDIINENEKNNYNVFFDEIISDMEKEANDDSSIMASLILRYREILRINNLSSIAENTEKLKASARKDIELFLKTINEFILNSEEEKEIVISNGGEIGFKTKHNKKTISIHYLSSGEKQLLIFFANLIFNIGKRKDGIFVVDEPELSLHLSWQKMFVEKTTSINPNIQLIFATHSPEFVGKYRNRMFKLEKKIKK